jgi:hypothetical protein
LRFISIRNPKSKIPSCTWWTERDSNSYEKFAKLLCCRITSSARNKIGVEGGNFTRTSLVLTKPHPLCASLSVSATSTWKINTDGEIRTHITTFLKRVPLAELGYVGVKKKSDSGLNPEFEI